MKTLLALWLPGFAAVVGLLFLVWLISLGRRDASIIDIFWGPGFALATLLYALRADGWTPRETLVLALVAVWGLRLAAHILARSLGKDEDYRYGEMRSKHGPRFWWVSLFTVFLLQGALIALISAPLLQAIRSAVPARWTGFDLVAVALFAVGFLFEAVGDFQLSRFRADPANRGKVLRRGLWRYTRHPNYFGDAVVWWGFFFFALATPGSVWTIYSPILMTFLLLKVSGVGLLEKKLRRARSEYADYVETTNAFVPWFPKSGTRDSSRA